MDEFSEVSLLIADRATLFRHGLRGLLRVHRPGWACAEASSMAELRAHLRAEPVDIVLFDLQLGGIAGLQELHRDFPNQPIMVLSDCDERVTILECLSAGAGGYILKSTTLPLLLRATETVLSGSVFAPAALAAAPAVPARRADADHSPLLTHLTERQIEVFRLLSEGCATKTIARRLDLAVGPVKVHLAAIYRVLGAHNRVEALAKARGRLLRSVPTPPAAELLAA